MTNEPLTITNGTVRSELSTFVHKVLYAHAGAFILLVALIGAGGYFGLRSYDKALAHAEALQVQFNQAQAQFTASQKQLTDLLAADSAQRAAESAQQASLEQQILNRNTQVPVPVVKTALQPDATAAQAATGLGASYSDVPSFGPVTVTTDGKVALSVPQVQGAISAHEDEKRLAFDLQAETSLYTLETSKSTSLSNDLQQCRVTEAAGATALVDADKTITAFKKAAHRSLFRRILGKAETVALVVAAFELGHKL